MNFENQYLKYDEYISFGGKLNEMPFNLLEFKARMLIDESTLGRIKKLPIQNQNVKMCVYDLINNIEINENINANKSISSENIDGYSVSYNTMNESILNSNLKANNDIIYNYLINCRLEDGTPYLYRGV